MLATAVVHFPDHHLHMDLSPCWHGAHAHAHLWNDLHNEWSLVDSASAMMDMQHQADVACWRQQAGAFDPWFPQQEHASWNNDMAMCLDEGVSSPALPEVTLCNKFPATPHDLAISSPRFAAKEESHTDSGRFTTDCLASVMSPMLLPVGPKPASPLWKPLPAAMPIAEATPLTLELPPGLPASLLRSAPVIAKLAKTNRIDLSAAVGEAVVTPPQEQAAAAAIPTTPAPLAAAVNSANNAVEEVAPGVCIAPTEVGGKACTMVGWCIEDLRSKLRASMGRSLVSPPFSVGGLCNLRFIVCPDARDLVRNACSRDRKGVYATMIKKGPLHGSLKLKADCLEVAASVSFYLTVGSVRCGPFAYDFSESAIHGCDDFDVDWLQQIDAGTGNLSVSAEILDFTARTLQPPQCGITTIIDADSKNS